MDIILSKIFLAKSAGTIDLALFFTYLGEIGVIAVLTLFLMMWWWKNKKREAVFFGGVVAFAGIMIYVLKKLIARPRPGFALVAEQSYSFPSGHALSAMVFFGLLAYLQIQNVSWQKKILFWMSAGFLILMISWSRLALGVHWTSDIVGGWAIGAIILCISIQVHKKYFRS